MLLKYDNEQSGFHQFASRDDSKKIDDKMVHSELTGESQDNLVNIQNVRINNANMWKLNKQDETVNDYLIKLKSYYMMNKFIN